MQKTVEEFLLENDAPRNTTSTKRKSGYCPVNKNSADYQDYQAECEKITKQQAAEKEERDQRRKNEKFAAAHYCSEPTIEYEDLPHNQNQVFDNPEKWNWIFPAFCIVLFFAALFWFGAL